MAPPSRVIDETAEAGTPLRQLFTDLIAFAVAFRETCETRPWAPADLRDRLTTLIEAQERLDFAERLLSKGREEKRAGGN